jgi:hypothetical protein
MVYSGFLACMMDWLLMVVTGCDQREIWLSKDNGSLRESEIRLPVRL